MEVMIPESEPIPATESGTTDKAKEERGKKEKGLALSATRKGAVYKPVLYKYIYDIRMTLQFTYVYSITYIYVH